MSRDKSLLDPEALGLLTVKKKSLSYVEGYARESRANHQTHGGQSQARIPTLFTVPYPDLSAQVLPISHTVGTLTCNTHQAQAWVHQSSIDD